MKKIRLISGKRLSSKWFSSAILNVKEGPFHTTPGASDIFSIISSSPIWAVPKVLMGRFLHS